MATAPATTHASRTSVAREAARDRMFYGGMAAIMGLTVFVGFSSTYYLRLLSGGPKVTLSGRPFTTIVYVHGALFTSWVLLFIVQSALIAQRRVAVHRRLGIAGGVLAASMVVAGTWTAIAAASRGSAPQGVDPLAFLAIPLFDLLLFSVFITTAFVKRRDRESHKRLMLLAYVSIIAAAIARLPGMLTLGPLAFFGLAFLFILSGVVYDWRSRHHVHRVYLWGGALFVISVPLRLMLSATNAWHTFAEILTG